MDVLNALKIFIPAASAFIIGVAATPLLTHFLYKYKMWKPRAGKTALDGTQATTFNGLHAGREVGTPRFGGVIVWGSVLLTAGIFSALAALFQFTIFKNLAFISRAETWVPLATLAVGAFVGGVDDLFEIRGTGGLRLRTRLYIVASVALLCALWFYVKLGVSSVSILFVAHPVPLNVFFIPVFVFVALFIYAGGVIDGIDGLAGGVFISIFGAYAGIALFEGQPNLAAFCAAMAGGLLAFLWFNIPPARFYLSETGTMGLTLSLTVVAFLSDTLSGGRGVAVLPIIALLLVATVFSNILQVAAKKLTGKKILHIAPLHHHFEALGWPPYKVTMRYWIVGIVAALIGMTVAIL